MADELTHLAAELGGPLLALDTSSMSASLCFVGWGSTPFVEASLPANAQGSEGIAEAIEVQRQASGIGLADLRAIVVGVGPGSFTGLRVGLAMAKGLAFGGGIPLYGVSSLAMLAASQGSSPSALALEARKGEIFAAVYDGHRALVDDCLTTPAAFAVTLTQQRATLFSDVEIPGHPAQALNPLRAAFGIAIAAPRIRKGEADDVATLVPSYLKLSEPERVALLRSET